MQTITEAAEDEVARAIYTASLPEADHPDWDSMNASVRSIYRRMARAAMERIREMQD